MTYMYLEQLVLLRMCTRVRIRVAGCGGGSVFFYAVLVLLGGDLNPHQQPMTFNTVLKKPWLSLEETLEEPAPAV